MTYHERYEQVYKEHFKRTYPSAFKDGHYAPPKFPDVKTSNGLTAAIINYLTWAGQYGNRINSMGRLIKAGKDVHSAGGGTIHAKQIMIKGSTKKGSEDVDTIINTYPVKLEIKVGKDYQKQAQKEHEQKVKQAGGYYYIIRTIEDFFVVFDKFMNAPKREIF